MRKSLFCISEIKGADQLRSACNCEADQRFHYTDSTVPLLFPNSKQEAAQIIEKCSLDRDRYS